MRPFIECGESRVETGFEQNFRLLCRLVELGLGLVIRREALALDADRLKLIDHRAVTGNPRFVLDDAVELIEEARVVLDRRIEHDIGRVDENRLGRIVRLRQRIELDALAIGHRLGHIGFAVTL